MLGRMGIYSHLTITELGSLRDRLIASLTDRLTAPTSAATGARNVAWQQRTTDIRREIEAINAELAVRDGQATRRPIHVI